MPLLFWPLIWYVAAKVIDNPFLFPRISDTAEALFQLVKTQAFYKSVALSAVRVVVGLSLGCLSGVLLGLLCSKFSIIDYLISPIMTVIRSTPVASFIVVLWVLMSGDALSVFIGFIMVMPIIWQSTSDGMSAIDKNLLEVTRIFEFSRIKKFKLLTLPTLKQFLIPAIISSVGLAWKAEIAAEIIAYTKNSIGQGINDAKYVMDTPTVFAWTAIVVVFSITLEALTKALLRRHKNGS